MFKQNNNLENVQTQFTPLWHILCTLSDMSRQVEFLFCYAVFASKVTRFTMVVNDISNVRLHEARQNTELRTL